MSGNFFKIFGIIGIFILAILVSGCTSLQPTSLNNTFNKSGISFNYSSDWKEVPFPKLISSGTGTEDIGAVASPDNKTMILVFKNPLTANETVEQTKDATKLTMVGSSMLVLSDTKVNITGASESFELITNNIDPRTSIEQKGFYIVTGNAGQVAYAVQFKGEAANFNETMRLYNKILPTIQIQ